MLATRGFHDVVGEQNGRDAAWNFGAEFFDVRAEAGLET